MIQIIDTDQKHTSYTDLKERYDTPYTDQTIINHITGQIEDAIDDWPMTRWCDWAKPHRLMTSVSIV